MIKDLPLAHSLLLQTERDPERTAIEFEGSTISYGRLSERVLRMAGALGSLGCPRGSVVALLGHNSPEYAEILLAASAAGCVVLPLNWRLAADEVAYIVEHSGAVVLFADAELGHVAQASLAKVARRVDLVGIGAGWARIPASNEIRDASDPRTPVDVGGDELARLMYTSGTTGRPKGVMITHGNVLWKNIAHARELGITDRDTGLVVGPLYHVGALDITFTTHVFAGGGVILHRRFDASAALEDFESGRVDTAWLAPAMLRAILVEAEKRSVVCDAVRCIVGGGEKTPLPMFERIWSVFPEAWYADAYGLTETVSGDTFLPRRSARAKAGSVGVPCLGIEVAVLDDDGAACAAGVAGEVVLRGPKVAVGYWNDVEASGRAFRDGWFHTGDVGFLDDDGYLTLVDRLKDMIISGGENIASAEIERVLYEHPAVAEAAAVGRPDERWGEVPVAHVVLAPGHDVDGTALITHCAERLAKYKVPREVVFVSELPRNPSGKILKRELRARNDHQ